MHKCSNNNNNKARVFAFATSMHTEIVHNIAVKFQQNNANRVRGRVKKRDCVRERGVWRFSSLFFCADKLSCTNCGKLKTKIQCVTDTRTIAKQQRGSAMWTIESEIEGKPIWMLRWSRTNQSISGHWSIDYFCICHCDSVELAF